ncbi:MAG TPA: response regulator [Thermoanaerobaculia bacterium]|nr:response regulator [Thermoanaerobaculia bacterium]
MEKRILVADDSLTIQKVVELTFADSEYRLTSVSNGRLALEKIREERPDIVLADVVMPEKNGYEVCEEIKRNPATAGIPVILLAGTFEPFDRDRATQLGCDAIVSKPFDSRELYRKVEALVAARSQPAAAERPEAPVAPLRDTSPEPVLADEPRAPSSLVTAPASPFDGGFVEEDFTGSIRTVRAGSGEPLASLYGPEDIESALATFREVEPPARASDWRGSPRPVAEPEEPQALPASDEGRTQRIDVSEFRPPEASPRGGSTMEIEREAVAATRSPAEVVEFVQPVPPVPMGGEAPPPAAVGGETSPPRELTETELDRLVEKLAAKLVEKLSDRIVREVAWEVVPEAAELAVRERLRELESGVE